MPVLDIKNRIVPGMLDHLGQIEIECSIVFSVEHVEADSIAPDLIHHFTQRDELPCSLRHFDWFTGAKQANQLHELYIEVRFAAADRFDRGLHPPDIAAVVGAPDVDQVQKAARHL